MKPIAMKAAGCRPMKLKKPPMARYWRRWQNAVKIGAVEKMSKSKKNIVDPDDIIARYGADTARWFMLSDSPPERDVQWTQDGIEGAWRFEKVWRLFDAARGDFRDQLAAPEGAAAAQLYAQVQATIDAVTRELEGSALIGPWRGFMNWSTRWPLLWAIAMKIKFAAPMGWRN